MSGFELVRSKNNTKLFLLIVISGVLGLATGCNSDDSADNESASTPTGSASQVIEGAGQKGPFAMGATATASAYDPGGPPVEESVTVTVGENGHYSFEDKNIPDLGRADGYMIRVSGSIFNEITGNFTPGERALSGLLKKSEHNVNVNLFTDILVSRIKVLMASAVTSAGPGESLSYESAIDKATIELSEIFGLETLPSQLNLLHDEDSPEDSANLLLFSAALLKADINEPDLQKIEDDFARNGEIDSAGSLILGRIAQAIRSNPNLLDTARLRLENQYGVEPPRLENGEVPPWVSDFADLAGDDDDSSAGNGESTDESSTDSDDGDPESDQNNNDTPIYSGGDPSDLQIDTISGTVDGNTYTFGGIESLPDYDPENIDNTDSISIFTYFTHPAGDPLSGVDVAEISNQDNLSALTFGRWSLTFFDGLSGEKLCGIIESTGPEGAGGSSSDVLITADLPIDNEQPTTYSTSALSSDGDEFRTKRGECSATIDRYDGPGGIMTGTFSGRLYSADGDSIEVRNGAFRINLPSSND